MKQFSVYIMSNHSHRLYVGVTNDLSRRVYEHKQQTTPSFTSRYNLTQLIHFENFSDVREAIAREKQIKGWTRAKKIALIELSNIEWRDLAG